MINTDAQGNKSITMAWTGDVIPLEPIAVQVRIETVSHGQIMGVDAALAVERASAQYWFAKFKEQQQTIADLRAQISNGG